MIEAMTDLTDKQKRKILWENGLRFCGLKTEQFLDAGAATATDAPATANSEGYFEPDTKSVRVNTDGIPCGSGD